MHRPFEQIYASYTQELGGLAAKTLEIHPGGDPARWNGRQIVEHLILTYRSSSSIFRERLEKGRPTQAQATIRHRAAQFVLLRMGYFPPGRPAPQMVRPADTPDPVLDGDALAALFGTELQAMDELLGPCCEQFGKQTFASHQILGPLSADQWRRFHIVHARHHLKQLCKLKQLRFSDLP